MIPRNHLAFVRNQLLDKDTETCGVLEYKFGFYTLDKITKGTVGSCKFPAYTEYVWHTHPKVSKAYIGSHDVITVLRTHKNPYDWPKVSLIFTLWGIWEFSAQNKRNFSEENLESIKNYINSKMEKVYCITEKGRGELNSRSLQILLEGIQAISVYINDNYKSKLSIVFTEWSKIREGYPLYFDRKRTDKMDEEKF